jgi:hypothetical protein
MKRVIGRTLCFGVLTAAAAAGAAADDGDGPFRPKYVTARLRSFNEVPAVSSPARGRFSGVLQQDALEYRLTYDDLQANVLMAHIHFAQPDVNGGIVVWLCASAAVTTAPAGTQACPQSGTIEGTIVAADVQAQLTQGIDAGGFEELARIIRAGFAYVNVHTEQSPGGEIRGQIKVQKDRYGDGRR